MITVITECNTEEIVAETLLEEKCQDNVKKCILHPRHGGIGRALKNFEVRARQSSKTSYGIIGLVADLERGKITQKKVEQVITKIFQNLEPTIVYNHNDKKILFYKKNQNQTLIFAILFDPWFEEVLSQISKQFKELYKEQRSHIKRNKNKGKLREIMKEETIINIIQEIKALIFKT
jgi:hypothetical protein